LVSTSGVTLPA